MTPIQSLLLFGTYRRFAGEIASYATILKTVGKRGSPFLADG